MIILADDAREMIYGERELQHIARHVQLLAPPMTTGAALQRPDLLAQTELLFSGWGGPRLDESFLSKTPRLKALFYGAGSLASIVTDAVWKRDITITTALAANSVPVAEYTLATILLSLKHGFRLMRETREWQKYPDRNQSPGCFERTVGLISLGTVARALLKLLKPFELKVIVYDPFLSEEAAAELGVERVSLDELFSRADVVSLHSPWIDETTGMITGRHFELMRPGSTFINTARAPIVRQDELIEVAKRRPELNFVLDVASPEPPEPGSPLYTLPNVVLTPHMAGSVGHECRRMGRYIGEELERFIAGRPLQGLVTAESIQSTCHIQAGVAGPKVSIEKQPPVRVKVAKPSGTITAVRV